MTLQATNSKERQTPALNQLYCYLTEGCNLACRHCWLSPKFDPAGNQYQTLPVELFELAIREAKPLGLRGIKLTGGEPLLHPQCLKFLEVVRREELALTIETNGLLCTPALASEIAKFPRRFVAISIDGADAATHDQIRGVPGAFKQAQQAVRNLAAADTPPQVIMTLMRQNVDQVEAVVKMAEKLGASSVKFNVVEPMGRGENFHKETVGLDIEELVRLGRYIEMTLTGQTRLRLSFSSPLAFRPLSRIASGGADRCDVFGILGIIPDGRYALCGIGSALPELVFGAIGTDRLAEVWRDNTILQALRAGLPDRLKGVCARCVMRHTCLGSCIAQNVYRTHNLWSPFWFCEQAERLGLFPQSRLMM